VARTRTDLWVISEALRNVATFYPDLMKPDVITNLEGRTLYHFLSNTNLRVRVLAPRDDWDRLKTFRDRMGRPIRVEATVLMEDSNHSSTLTYQVKLWSLGLNGRDESGAGDDIVVTTNIQP
jgi:hypothetical protein